MKCSHNQFQQVDKVIYSMIKENRRHPSLAAFFNPLKNMRKPQPFLRQNKLTERLGFVYRRSFSENQPKC